MGLFERMGDIINSNINALLDKAEDPVKMAKYYLEQYYKDLAECKEDTATLGAQLKARKRELEQSQQEVDDLTAKATRALQAGDEDAARVFLSRKAEASSQLETASKNCQLAQQQYDRMVQIYNKLVSDINVCKARVQNIEATAALTKNQEKVNDIMSKYGTGSKGAGKLARAEARMQDKLDAADAYAELDAPADAYAELDKKYGSSGAGNVDAELEKMKAELGL